MRHRDGPTGFVPMRAEQAVTPRMGTAAADDARTANRVAALSHQGERSIMTFWSVAQTGLAWTGPRLRTTGAGLRTLGAGAAGAAGPAGRPLTQAHRLRGVRRPRCLGPVPRRHGLTRIIGTDTDLARLAMGWTLRTLRPCLCLRRRGGGGLRYAGCAHFSAT